MSPLDEIRIELVDSHAADAPSPQVKALLRELQALLQDLVNEGKSASVDIRSLPLSPIDYDFLKSFLGEGEVTATINALGPTTIRETEIPGIWWVTHSNADEMILTESIEVTELPEMLKTQQQDLQHAIALFVTKTDGSKTGGSGIGEVILES